MAHVHEHSQQHSHEHNHHSHEHSHEHTHEHQHSNGEESRGFPYVQETISFFMLAAGMILQQFNIFSNWSLVLGSDFDFVALIWYFIAILPVGIPTIKKAGKAWEHLDFMNEFTLMLLATIGAFLLGEYPEGVAILLFYSFGEKMEDTASDKVRDHIRSLIGRLPSEAEVVDSDGNVTSVSPEKVEAGLIIAVKPGSRVPIDGVLLGDDSIDFDTSAITGESVPRNYSAGEEIMSGMIPIDCEVRLRTVRAFSDSSMSRIMQMIESASAQKSPTENMLRRITRWYTPVVMVMAIMLFCVPWIVSFISGTIFDREMWLNRSLVFLVCSCPCALVVGVPLSYFAALGTASRYGLLFKGSRYIDTMRRLGCVLFDKTGTLTTGEFSVVKIIPASGHDENEVVSLAYALDVRSSHPLAKAINSYASSHDIKASEVDDVKTISHGMTAKCKENDKIVAVGSRSLMQSQGVAIYDSSDNEAYTEICVACDSILIGTIYLADTVKSDSSSLVEKLHKLSVGYVGILSGDRKAVVENVAKAIGADGCQGELLPADKQKYVQKMHESGRTVAFVGDGINDAPAMAAADIGISMGTIGTDIAMETSDVVIVGDDLSKIPLAIRLAHRVRWIVMASLIFALAVKAIVMLLGALGIATLWAAVFADTGVTLIVVAFVLLFTRMPLR